MNSANLYWCIENTFNGHLYLIKSVEIIISCTYYIYNNLHTKYFFLFNKCLENHTLVIIYNYISTLYMNICYTLSKLIS